jgi:hypothetical protein
VEIYRREEARKRKRLTNSDALPPEGVSRWSTPDVVARDQMPAIADGMIPLPIRAA